MGAEPGRSRPFDVLRLVVDHETRLRCHAEPFGGEPEDRGVGLGQPHVRGNDDVVEKTRHAAGTKALREAAERLRHELDLRAVAIELGDGAGRFRTVAGDTSAFPAVQSGGTGPLRVLAEAAMELQDNPRRPRARWVRVIPPAVTAALARGPRNQLHMVPILYGGRRLGRSRWCRGREGRPSVRWRIGC